MNMPDFSILIYQTGDGLTKVNVTFDDDTVWLTQDQMAELFQKAKSTINYHIQQVYEDGELSRDATMRKFENFELSTKPLNFYNLDMVISVGYRVKSQRGVQFRLWASGIIKEYMRKGFAMDDARLKELGAVISRNCWRVYGISALRRRCFTGRCWRFMPRVLIMTQKIAL